MVALEELASMAPGTSGMLRARKRDTNVKPNRILDRTASRGMLYENEELRLRTININADLEKGQQYIKKLRRENEQLRKEIWNLRDQYDRLETVLRSKQQQEYGDYEYEENDYGDGEDGDNGSFDELPENFSTGRLSNKILSTVEEESEESLDDNVAEFNNVVTEQNNLADKETASDLSLAVIPIFENIDSNDQRSYSDSESRVTELDKNSSVTFAFKLEDALKELTVEQVIDALEEGLKDAEFSMDVVKSVRLNDDHCYVTVKEELDCDSCRGIKHHLIQKKLHINGTFIQLHPILANTIVSLRVSGIPHQLPDRHLINVFSSLADVISSDITRVTYKGIDTGDRLIRLQLQRDLCSQNEPTTKNTAGLLPRRKSFKSQLKINLKVPDEWNASKGGADVMINAESTISDQKSVCNDEKSVCSDGKSVCNDGKLVCNNGKSVCNNGKSVCNNGKSVCNNGKSVCNDENVASNDNLAKGEASKLDGSGCSSQSFFSKNTGVILNETVAGDSDGTNSAINSTGTSDVMRVTANNADFESNSPDQERPGNTYPISNSRTHFLSRQTSSTDLKEKTTVAAGAAIGTAESPVTPPTPTGKNSIKRSQRGSSCKSLTENSSNIALAMIRKPSVNFKNNNSNADLRRPSFDYSMTVADGVTGGLNKSYRERSNSDASSKASICRRRLSVTGHEEAGKIPWCGCWGTGCC